jgi:hypothetical protein
MRARKLTLDLDLATHASRDQGVWVRSLEGNSSLRIVAVDRLPHLRPPATADLLLEAVGRLHTMLLPESGVCCMHR